MRIRNETLDFAMPPYGGAPNPCEKLRHLRPWQIFVSCGMRGGSTAPYIQNRSESFRENDTAQKKRDYFTSELNMERDLFEGPETT